MRPWVGVRHLPLDRRPRICVNPYGLDVFKLEEKCVAAWGHFVPGNG